MNRSSLLLIVILIGTLELLLQISSVPRFLVPLPSEVGLAFFDNRTDLWQAFLETASHALSGLALSFVLGVGLAFLISLSEKLGAAILPVALFFQTIPIIAIAPMLVIWFGYGAPSVVAASTIVSFFPILASTIQGLEAVPPSMQELFRLQKASFWATYTKLKFPYAIPFIYGGVRIALGLAVVGTLVGEFIGGSGLGSLIDSARTQQRVDLVFAAVGSSSLLGYGLTVLAEEGRRHFLQRWFPHP